MHAWWPSTADWRVTWLARSQLTRDAEGAGRTLEAASEELNLALAELRDLARGIHPAVLSDRGLQPALEGLTLRMAERGLVVDMEDALDQRLPEQVEVAAYYVVAESLANVSKYAGADRVSVRVMRENGRAIVEVRDDGRGGADPGRGSGLRGLFDRVEALDGRLSIDSPPGAGTTIRAEIPCG